MPQGCRTYMMGDGSGTEQCPLTPHPSSCPFSGVGNPNVQQSVVMNGQSVVMNGQLVVGTGSWW